MLKEPIFVEKDVEEMKKESSVELSIEEKKEIDELLSVDHALENISLDRDSELSNEEIKKAILAQQKMISFGARELSYIKDKIADSNPIMFSELAYKIAGEENVEELTDVLCKKAYLNVGDFLSPFQVLNYKLRDLIKDIRKKNPKDERLEYIAERLINALDDITDDRKYNKVTCQETLSLTGSQAALKYINDNSHELSSQYKEFHSDADNYDQEHFCLYGFPTLEEFLRARMSFKSGDADLTDFSDFSEINSLGADEIFLSDEEKWSIIKSRDLINSRDVEETIRPLARLYAFNRLKSNYSRENIEHIFKGIDKLEKREKVCKDEKLLPTIGVEIECHYSDVDINDIKMLSIFSIPNEDEPGVDLWEINPDFSYSAIAQARYLQEIFNAGLITHDFDENGRVIIPKDHLLSLHVNLGVPSEITDKDEKLKKESYYLNDTLNYAFTSPVRVSKRKTADSVGIKGGAKKSDKNIRGSLRSWRLELRASEFRDYKTYKMLDSAQKLGAAFFCSFRRREGALLTKKEMEMVNIWSDFMDEYRKIMREYDIWDFNLFDEDREDAVELAENEELRLECQKLIYAYVKKINKLLFDNADEARKE